MVTAIYVDASAAVKLLVHETESSALREALKSAARPLVASFLLHTELHCAAGRRPELIAADAVNAVLSTLTLVDVTRGDLLSATTHPPLRSNDAIHLATALRLGVDELLSYDRELADAATAAGLRVLAPGYDVGTD